MYAYFKYIKLVLCALAIVELINIREINNYYYSTLYSRANYIHENIIYSQELSRNVSFSTFLFHGQIDMTL